MDSLTKAELTRPEAQDSPRVPEAQAEGTKHDGGKAPMDLISPVAIFELAEVLKFGATKYAEHNWRKGLKWSRVIAAAMRHLEQFAAGVDMDAETGLLHIAHAMCCCMFLIEYHRTQTGTDDRYKIKDIEAILAGIKTKETP